MRDFVDKTLTKKGTPINRANLMAIQGFADKETVFGENVITETYTLPDGKTETLETVFSGNTITEKFTGEKTIVKKTTFNDDGSITEEVS